MSDVVQISEVAKELYKALSYCGGYAAIGLAAIGSAIGAGLAGSAAIGAWKRCYVQDRPAPFLLLALAGSPLSQTIYGMILMMVIKGKLDQGAHGMWPFYLTLGFLAGFGFLFSSWYQGRVAAAGCDAYGDTEKGFANYLMVIGVVETVSIFVLVFALMVL